MSETFLVERDENARWHFFCNHNKRIRTWDTIIKQAIPFNIHTPTTDEVFSLDNPQKIIFTHNPSEISMDELILIDTLQKCLWMRLFFLYTPQKCLWMRLSFLYNLQKCLFKQKWVFFLLFPSEEAIWIGPQFVKITCASYSNMYISNKHVIFLSSCLDNKQSYRDDNNIMPS